MTIGSDGVTADPAPTVVARDGRCWLPGLYRHASKHHEEIGHPVMRSHEPNEAWRLAEPGGSAVRPVVVVGEGSEKADKRCVIGRCERRA